MNRFPMNGQIAASRRRGPGTPARVWPASGRWLAVVGAVALTTCAVPVVLGSERLNWPSRTGPTGNSHGAAADVQGLPTVWNEADDVGIRWKLPLEGRGNSVPIIGFNTIWLTAATVDGRQQYVYAIDQQTGRVLHHRLLFENADPEPLMNEVNTYASPTCALDDEAVYVHFGTYGTARLNRQTAEVEWQRRDINCRHYRGPGSSPVLFEDLLILTMDGIDQQYLTALNKRTGATVWKTARTTDYGDLDQNGQPRQQGDLRKAYGTPGLQLVAGRMQLVSIGSRAAFGYDARTGEELWTVRHDDFNASAPPCFHQSLVIINTGDRRANVLAIRLDETARGDITDTHVVWDRDKGNSDLSAPVLVGERLYMVANNGVCTCLDVNSGQELWQHRLEGTFTASPLVAGQRIYFCNEEGTTTVLEAADAVQIVAVSQLAEGLRASPAVADGTLFLRTFGFLYAIGQR